jgi:hypothetical protein
MKKYLWLLAVLIIACGRPIPDNDTGLDTVWVTWADGGGATYYYFAYSSGKYPDSVLHVSGGHRFFKPSGDSYDVFVVPKGIDSVVHETFYAGQDMTNAYYISLGIFPAPTVNPKHYLPADYQFESKEFIYEERNSRWGKVKRKAGICVTGWTQQ